MIFIPPFSGEWISPVINGDCPPPCEGCILTSVAPDTFIMLGGDISHCSCNNDASFYQRINSAYTGLGIVVLLLIVSVLFTVR